MAVVQFRLRSRLVQEGDCAQECLPAPPVRTLRVRPRGRKVGESTLSMGNLHAEYVLLISGLSSPDGAASLKHLFWSPIQITHVSLQGMQSGTRQVVVSGWRQTRRRSSKGRGAAGKFIWRRSSKPPPPNDLSLEYGHRGEVQNGRHQLRLVLQHLGDVPVGRRGLVLQHPRSAPVEHHPAQRLLQCLRADAPAGFLRCCRTC
jgi:hypothetical protein